MPLVQYYTATSLDGFIADAHHSLQWLFDCDADTPDNDRFPAFMKDVGVQVMGRTTYEWVLDHENLRHDEERWRQVMADGPTYVFAHGEVSGFDHPDFHVVSGQVSDHIESIEQAAAGKNVWVVGGGDLAGQFDDVGRLDQLILSVASVTLGGGAPLLPRRLESDRLSLRECEHDSGFVYLTYDVSRP